MCVCVQGPQREAVLRDGALSEQHLGHFRWKQEQTGESCVHLQTAGQGGEEHREVQTHSPRAVHTKHARGTDVVLWTVRPSCVYIDKLMVKLCFLSGTEILSWAKVNTTHIFIIIIVCRNGQKASETFQSVLVFEAVLLLFVLSVVGVSQWSCLCLKPAKISTREKNSQAGKS